MQHKTDFTKIRAGAYVLNSWLTCMQAAMCWLLSSSLEAACKFKHILEMDTVPVALVLPLELHHCKKAVIPNIQSCQQ